MILKRLFQKPQLLYHCYVILLFAVLYYTLAKYRHDEDEHFKDFGSTLYYTIVTHFTVGYGDIYPKTALLKTLCCIHLFISFSLTL